MPRNGALGGPYGLGGGTGLEVNLSELAEIATHL